MRTPETVIDQLMIESKQFTRLGIAVKLGRQWHFVVADGPNPTAELRRLVDRGGEPVGMVGYAYRLIDEDTGAKLLTCHSSMFPEYEHDSATKRAFDALVCELKDYVESQCGKAMLGNLNSN